MLKISREEALDPNSFESLSVADVKSATSVVRVWREFVYKQKCKREIPECNPTQPPHCGWEACWKAWASFRDNVARGELQLLPEDPDHPQDPTLTDFLRTHRLMGVFCMYLVVGSKEGKLVVYNMHTQKTSPLPTEEKRLCLGAQVIFPCAEGFFLRTAERTGHQKIFLCDVMEGRLTYLHTVSPLGTPPGVVCSPISQIIGNGEYVCVLDAGTSFCIHVIVRRDGSYRPFHLHRFTSCSQNPNVFRMQWGPGEDRLLLLHRSGCSPHISELNLQTGEHTDLFCARQRPECAVTDILSSKTTLFLAVNGGINVIPYTSKPPFRIEFDPTPSSGRIVTVFNEEEEPLFFHHRSGLASIGHPKSLFSLKVPVDNPSADLDCFVNSDGRPICNDPRFPFKMLNMCRAPLIPLINGAVLLSQDSGGVLVYRWSLPPEGPKEAPAMTSRRLYTSDALAPIRALIERYNSAS